MIEHHLAFGVSRTGAEGVPRDRGHVHVHVDPVQEGRGQPGRVSTHGSRVTGTGSLDLGEPSAGTGVHGCHEQETGRELDARSGPCDPHDAVFERLAKRFQGHRAKLRQLIEKQNAVVGEGDLAGTDGHSSTHKADAGDRVVWSSKRSTRQQPGPGKKPASYAVHRRSLECLFERQRWEDRRQRSSQHRLADAGSSPEQDTVSPRRGDFQGTFRRPLTADLAEVERLWNCGLVENRNVLGGWELRFASQELQHLTQVPGTQDAKSADCPGLGKIRLGDDQALKRRQPPAS
jgi:hypothetical protein